MTTPQPKRITCLRCDGKKWFPSAAGEIACPACDATGKGPIDWQWLFQDWLRLKLDEIKREHDARHP